MYTIIDQIKSKCDTIAENQAKIYALGYKTGKNDIEFVRFIVSDNEYMAIQGMNWHNYANHSSLNDGSFTVVDNDAFFNGTKIDTTADSIIENISYQLLASFDLTSDSQTHKVWYNPSDNSWGNFVSSPYNTIGLYFQIHFKDTELEWRILSTSNGKPVYSKNTLGSFEAVTISYGGSLYIDPAYTYTSDVYSFKCGSRQCRCDSGITWQQFIDSVYADNEGFYIKDNCIYNNSLYTGALIYDGAVVSPSDVIINNITYDSSYVIPKGTYSFKNTFSADADITQDLDYYTVYNNHLYTKMRIIKNEIGQDGALLYYTDASGDRLVATGHNGFTDGWDASIQMKTPQIVSEAYYNWFTNSIV